MACIINGITFGYSVPKVVKDRVRFVSGDLMTHDRLHYKEREFWMCIFNAH
jgi:hypothetical protein